MLWLSSGRCKSAEDKWSFRLTLIDLLCSQNFNFYFLKCTPSSKHDSMYHAMGYSSILVMQAGMTFDPKDMDAAMASLGEALQTCQRY